MKHHATQQPMKLINETRQICSLCCSAKFNGNSLCFVVVGWSLQEVPHCTLACASSRSSLKLAGPLLACCLLAACNSSFNLYLSLVHLCHQVARYLPAHSPIQQPIRQFYSSINLSINQTKQSIQSQRK